MQGTALGAELILACCSKDHSVQIMKRTVSSWGLAKVRRSLHWKNRPGRDLILWVRLIAPNMSSSSSF